MSDGAGQIYERLLVLRCQGGDETALRELIERYSPGLRLFLANTCDRLSSADDLLDVYRKMMIVKKGTVATFVGSIALMFLAAICTVSLIVLSRRATLRQLNMRLQEISVQIKGLSGPK